MARSELRALTGLRFAAAFIVVAAHANVGGEIAPWAMTTFFCLSGFVLTWRYPAGVKVGDYALARFARIYPLFAVLLVTYAVADRPGLETFVRHALLIQPWLQLAAADPFFAVSWSLGVEMFLYACFPLIVLLLGRASPRVIVAVAIGCVAVASVLAAGVSDFNRFVYFFPPGRLPDFVLGVCLARLALMGWRVRAPWIAVAAAAVVLVPYEPAFGKDALLMVPVGLALVALVDADAPRWLVTLGASSYALYLVHPLLLESALPVAAAIPAALALSVLLHRRVEEPARRWLRSRAAADGRVAPEPSPA